MKPEKVPVPEAADVAETAQTIPGWLKWLAGSSIASSFAYGSTYLTGLVYHQSYLSYFDVPSDIFKLSTSEYFIYAYSAWLELVPEWFNKIIGDYRKIALLFFLLLLVVSAAGLFVLLSETGKGKALYAKVSKSRTAYLTAGLVGMPAMAVVVIVSILTMLVSVMIIPALVGEEGAAKRYARSLKRYASKCETPVPRTNCVELVEEGKVLATGYVLEVSDRYIALLTPDGTKILPLKERTIQSHTPAKK